MPRSPATGALALFAAGALVSAITILNGVQPNDEGLMLGAAARIADGQVPYSDFWWYYPPGQAYLLGGLWEVFGPSLLTWRIVRVLVDGAVVAFVYLLARRRAGAGVSVTAAFGAAFAMAYPTGPHPVATALALALGALLLFERSPALAGVLVGLCAFWRLELAGYLAIGILLAYALDGAPRGVRIRRVLRFAGAGVATGALLYLPVVLSAGLSQSWELLVRWPLQEFSDQQSLPFPLDYDGGLNTSSISGFFSDSFENLLEFYLPLTLVIGWCAAVLALALRLRRDDSAPIALIVFSAGCLHYLLVRTDTFHTAPLAVTFSVLAAWAWSARGTAPSATLRLSRAAAVVAALAFLYLFVEGLDRRWLELRHDTERLHLGVADGVRADADEREHIERAVGFVQERVPPGEPIYVIGRRADWTTAGHPLFYALAGRPNPTRYDIAQPGIVTTSDVQEEIVDDLEESRPEVVMRWVDEVTTQPEPNKAGRPTGVRILDDYLRGSYAEEARFGDYVMLVRES